MGRARGKPCACLTFVRSCVITGWGLECSLACKLIIIIVLGSMFRVRNTRSISSPYRSERSHVQHAYPTKCPAHTQHLLIHPPSHPSSTSSLHTIPNTPPHPPPKLLPILPPQPPRLSIRRALIIRTPQQTNHTQQNTLRRLHGTPALGGFLVAVRVVFGRVQDRDANCA